MILPTVIHCLHNDYYLTSVTFLLVHVISVYSMPNHLSEKSILSPIYPIFLCLFPFIFQVFE